MKMVTCYSLFLLWTLDVSRTPHWHALSDRPSNNPRALRVWRWFYDWNDTSFTVGPKKSMEIGPGQKMLGSIVARWRSILIGALLSFSSKENCRWCLQFFDTKRDCRSVRENNDLNWKAILEQHIVIRPVPLMWFDLQHINSIWTLPKFGHHVCPVSQPLYSASDFLALPDSSVPWICTGVSVLVEVSKWALRLYPFPSFERT